MFQFICFINLCTAVLNRQIKIRYYIQQIIVEEYKNIFKKMHILYLLIDETIKIVR